MNDLRYPIGRFTAPAVITPSDLVQAIDDIATLPAQLRHAVQDWTEDQLDTPYRPDGWTVKQLVHHIADSHINAYCRFKLALTEDNPTIKTYEEKLWAELSDTRNLPVNISTTLLFALHARWVEILKAVSDDDWNRPLFHPGQQKEIRLWDLLGIYAWHGKHHVAHINRLRENRNW